MKVLCVLVGLIVPTPQAWSKLLPLDREQRAVLNEALNEAQRFGATHKETKALVEALIVESGIRNLPYGDADSVGALQQRPSTGWKHASNVRLAVRDFLKAARGVHGASSSGALAQAVQRSAFPGRYMAHAGEAERLISSPGRAYTSGTNMAPGLTSHVTVTGQAAQASARKRVALANYLEQEDPGSLLLRLGVVSSNEQVPSLQRHVSMSSPAQTMAGSHLHGGKSPLFELFYQGEGGIDVKNGQVIPQGSVSGHRDHVHVAAGPKTVVQLGRLAEQMGLHVGENPHFGGVNPVHVPHSYHYKGEAIDVSGNPSQMRKYAHRVAAIYGIK